MYMSVNYFVTSHKILLLLMKQWQLLSPNKSINSIYSEINSTARAKISVEQ